MRHVPMEILLILIFIQMFVGEVVCLVFILLTAILTSTFGWSGDM